MDLWIIILAAWLPIASIVLALCLYDMTADKPQAAMEGARRSDINPNPADES